MEFLKGVAKVFADSVSEEEIRGNVEAFSGKIFVFPSRRSSKFFIKYLGECWAQRFSKPMLTPQVCTISDLFSKMGGLETVDPVEASILLYREYVRLSCSQESFDDFLRWGEVLLADFNDIDNYLIDSKSIFTNIKDLKELDGDLSYLSDSQIEAIKRFWSSFHIRSKKSISQKEDSIDIKKEFTKVWMILPQLYADFKSTLLEKGKGYNGMIYRSVAERIANGERCWETDGRFQQNGEKISEYVFIGFNAPNKCEEALLEAMKREGCGDFYWDFVSPLVRCRENKASLWVESLEKRFPAKHPEYLNLIENGNEQGPEIEVIAVPGSVAQAEIAGDILEKIKDGEHFHTAVVLPQEDMLFPLLNAVPTEYETVNVTMGYPIALTPLGTFMSCVINLLKNRKEKGFYHRDIRSLLESDYIKGASPSEAAEIINWMVKGNRIFVGGDSILNEIDQLFKEEQDQKKKDTESLLKVIFSANCTKWQDVVMWQMEILKALDSIADNIGKEFITLYFKAIEKSLNYREMEEVTINTYYRIVSSLTASLSVPFQGEPLRGLQVVGPLEVRALDFENLIILNVNEGVFPKAQAVNSFIPYLLRKGFGLPTYELSDAIAAYHFYRSIYRSKKVWMLYDTRSEGVQSGEESRFIKQLKYHHNIKMKEYTMGNVSLKGKKEVEMSVSKSEEVIALMKKKFCSGENTKGSAFSATSITNYLFCPLQFYLVNVLELKEEADVEEGIEANTFGSIYHYVMQHLYEPYKGRTVECQDIQRMLSDIDSEDGTVQKLLMESFQEKMANPIGQNYISFKVLLKCIELTLKQEAGLLQDSAVVAPFKYIDGEKRINLDLQISDGLKVRLKGFIDRLDECNGLLRLSDYKTGYIDTITQKEENTMPDSLFPSGGKEFAHKVWFQLYFYALLLSEKGMIGPEGINATVYKVKEMNGKGLVSRYIGVEDIDKFKERTVKLLEEIFNPEIPFYQAPSGSRHCEKCPFKTICKR